VKISQGSSNSFPNTGQIFLQVIARKEAPRIRPFYKKTQRLTQRIYPVMMNSIEWPTAILPDASSHVLLPELELTDDDYAAAAEALRQLEDCFSEVVFIHEVASRIWVDRLVFYEF
jgi:hypothetical protein